MKPIYLDNAATTALRPEVIQTMTEVLTHHYGNASSTHSFGRSSKAILEQSRKNIAAHFNAQASEIVFTSGGTEADNLAMRSVVRDLGIGTIITSRIEHHAVLHTAEQLVSEYGVELLFVDLKPNGEINYTHLDGLLKSCGKALVSLMHINNEIGTILDMKRVAQVCKDHGALFHSDMVQSVGHYPIDMEAVPIDFFAASAHKFHGPKGVGFCYIRRNSGIKPQIFGGEQERGIRAGTESVHNIAGMEKALDLCYSNLKEESAYVRGLKMYFIEQVKKEIPGIVFNGCSADEDKSTYTLVNIRLPIGVDKAALLQFQLDLKGVACSKGSACQSGSVGQSHVLEAILEDKELLHPSLRFSFSMYNTKQEVNEVVRILKEFVES